MVKIAGAVAEEKFMGPPHSTKAIIHPGDHPFQLAERRYSNAADLNDYLDQILARTRTEIENHWADIEAIATALMQNGHLDGATVHRVLKHR